MIVKTSCAPVGQMEHHRGLRRLARGLYPIPGVKSAFRRATRHAILYWPLSVTNKQRLYNFLATDISPAKPVTCEVTVDTHRRLTLELDLSDDLSRRWYYWGYSGYEPATTEFFSQLLSSRKCVFDVGANVGYYALMAAAILEGRGEVHAFEPWADVFCSLQSNVSRNGFTCLRLNNSALSDRDGQQPLFLPSDPAARTNASLIKGFVEQGERTLVKSERFDTYCARRGVPPVDLMRIDVEGAEASVLRGMGVLLDTWRPDVICEVLPSYEAGLNDLLDDTPYRKFLLSESGPREVGEILADERYRDYYLSCNPVTAAP
jgi:FkbM family methyltransferase